VNISDSAYPWYDRDGNRVDIHTWGRLMCDLDYRMIKQEHVTSADGNTYWVSTVFVGIDMSWMRGGPPILFETMVFDVHGGVAEWGGREMQRYPTLESALEGHVAAVIITQAIGVMTDDDDATAETVTERKTR
jgi:hypothetical protein